MKKTLTLVVLILSMLTLVSELGLFNQGHAVNTTASTNTVTVLFILNESKPIDLVIYPSIMNYYYSTIDYSGYVSGIPFNQTLFIESQYPFAVNGTVAKYSDFDYKYVFAIPTMQNTVVYIDFLAKPLPKSVYVVDLNEFKSSYAFIDFHLNETKNISIWLSTSFTRSDRALCMQYTTINSSTIVPILKGYMVVLRSQFPSSWVNALNSSFEVNGTLAKFDYDPGWYTYSFFVSGNTTLNVDFINKVEQPTVTQQTITPSISTTTQQQQISSSIFSILSNTTAIFSSILKTIIYTDLRLVFYTVITDILRGSYIGYLIVIVLVLIVLSVSLALLRKAK